MADNWQGSHPGGEGDEDDLEVRPRRAGGEREAARAPGSGPAPADREWMPATRAPVVRPEAYRPAAYSPPPYVPAAAPTPAQPTIIRMPSRNAGNACIWILALVAVVVLACGALAAGVLRYGFDGLSGFVPRFPGLPLVTPTVVIQAQGPSVIQQIQALSRLETARYTIEQVETAESTGALPPLTSDKILFIAHGNVTAGVDLSQLNPADVQVVSGTVTVRLPAAEILSAELDDNKSYVYDRQTGFFTKADPNLETQVRQKAEADIEQAALEDGILDQAQANAETTVRALLRALQYNDVTFLPPQPAPLTPGPQTPVPDTPVPAATAVPSP